MHALFYPRSSSSIIINIFKRIVLYADILLPAFGDLEIKIENFAQSSYC